MYACSDVKIDNSVCVTKTNEEIVIDTYLVYLMTVLGYKQKQNSFI